MAPPSSCAPMHGGRSGGRAKQPERLFFGSPEPPQRGSRHRRTDFDATLRFLGSCWSRHAARTVAAKRQRATGAGMPSLASSASSRANHVFPAGVRAHPRRRREPVAARARRIGEQRGDRFDGLLGRARVRTVPGGQSPSPCAACGVATTGTPMLSASSTLFCTPRASRSGAIAASLRSKNGGVSGTRPVTSMPGRCAVPAPPAPAGCRRSGGARRARAGAAAPSTRREPADAVDVRLVVHHAGEHARVRLARPSPLLWKCSTSTPFGSTSGRTPRMRSMNSRCSTSLTTSDRSNTARPRPRTRAACAPRGRRPSAAATRPLCELLPLVAVGFRELHDPPAPAAQHVLRHRRRVDVHEVGARLGQPAPDRGGSCGGGRTAGSGPPPSAAPAGSAAAVAGPGAAGVRRPRGSAARERDRRGVAVLLGEAAESHPGAALQQVPQQVPGRDAVAPVRRPGHALAQEQAPQATSPAAGGIARSAPRSQAVATGPDRKERRAPPMTQAPGPTNILSLVNSTIRCRTCAEFLLGTQRVKAKPDVLAAPDRRGVEGFGSRRPTSCASSTRPATACSTGPSVNLASRCSVSA